MGVYVNIETEGIKKVETVLQTFQQRGGNLKPLLRRIGKILVAGVTKNFEDQGRPVKWKARSEFTNRIYANQAMSDYSKKTEGKKFVRLSTYKKGVMEAAGRRTGNLILSGSGELKKSIDDKLDGNSVLVGSALPYARIHQLGGVIVPKKAKALIIPTGTGVVRLKKVTIPARPYLTTTNEEERLITTASKLWILEGRVE